MTTEISNDELLELLSLTLIHSKTATFYLNASGQCHRIHGPAVIFANGKQEWFRNGMHHRDGGPAIICTNGRLLWFCNGELHRDDGPAIVNPNGLHEWYVNGILKDPLKPQEI